MLGLSLNTVSESIMRCGSAAAAPMPVAPPVSSINADGWSATRFVSGASAADIWANREALDPNTAPLAVTRPGFDASGAPGSVTDMIALTTEIRRPWNDANALDRVAATGGADTRTALSEFVYAGDTISGATNNSTRAYPKPQAMWLIPDATQIGNTLTASIFIDHKFARNGRPVAAVKFTASDGVNADIVATVTAMTTRTWTASGLSAPVYQVAMDISSLNNGAVTLDAQILPWVGDAVHVSSLTAAPSLKASLLTLYKDPAPVIRYAYTASTPKPESSRGL
jgi:hypothetical protein